MERSLATVLEGGSFYECPRWHDDRWFVDDIYRSSILSLTEDGTDVRTEVQLDTMLSGTGWLPTGELLVVAAQRRQVLRVGSNGDVVVHADLAGVCRGWANDMVVDEVGNAFVGDTGFDIATFDLTSGSVPPAGAVVPVARDGTVGPVADGPLMPNGMAVSADGTTLVVGETLGARYSAYAIGADGTLSNHRLWADLADPAIGRVAPDGCTFDAEGRIWCADAFGGRCLLVAEGGDVLEVLDTPKGLHVFACMLGGSDGRTLLLCCAPDFSPERRAGATDAVLLATRVDVPHAGRP